MTLDLQQLLLFGILAAAAHWLVARSEIMRWLWSRARGRAAKLLACPSCSGFWLGLGFGAYGLRPALSGNRYVDVVVAAAIGVFVTPVFEAVLLWGLERAAIAEADEAEPPPLPLEALMNLENVEADIREGLTLGDADAILARVFEHLRTAVRRARGLSELPPQDARREPWP